MVEFTTNGYFSSAGSSVSTPPPSSGFPFQFFKCNLESFSPKGGVEVLCAFWRWNGQKKSLEVTFSFSLGLYL